MASINTTLVGWEAESGGRGTWNIIWTCLTTALIAVWVVYHGPAPWDNRQFSHLSWPLNQLTMEKFIQLFMTGFVILLPEIYIYISAWQLVEAQEFRDEIRNSHPLFTLREAFFICLGGYRISIPSEQRENTGSQETRVLNTEQVLWLIGQGVLDWPHEGTVDGNEKPYRGSVCIGPIPVLRQHQAGPGPGDNSDSKVDQNIRSILQLPDLGTAVAETTTIVQAVNSGTSTTPKKQAYLLDREMIKLRSKSSGFAKFIVIFQAFWFIVNCIVRGVHQLPLSLLEVLTLSYIACTFVAYIFWWHKPQDVGACVTFELRLNYAEWKELFVRAGEDEWANGWMGVEYADKHWRYGARQTFVYWLTFLSSWLSGGVHFIAWNAEFPSKVEQILWRSCTVLLMCMTPLVVCDSRVFFFHQDHFTSLKWRNWVSNISALIAAIAKVIILVVAFLSLRSAPEAIYDTYVSREVA